VTRARAWVRPRAGAVAFFLAAIVAASSVAAPAARARSRGAEADDSISVVEHAFRAILSKEETIEYLSIPSDSMAWSAEWRRRYWRRIDPDPTTPSNEDGSEAAAPAPAAGAGSGAGSGGGFGARSGARSAADDSAAARIAALAAALSSTANERLAEHRSRVARARELFATKRGLVWDDRCAALVRFGSPLVRVSDGGETHGRFGVDPPRERWLYEDRMLYMEDRNLDGNFEYGITPRVSNIGRVDNLGEEDEFFKNGQFAERTNPLTNFDEHPEVERYFTDFSEARLVKMLQKGRETWAKEPSTFAPPKTGREIPFFFDLSTFRGRDGETDLVANYLIPLEAVSHDEGGAWVERRTAVLDDAMRLVGSEIEAIEQPVKGGSVRGKWILNAATIAVKPGSYEVASRVVDLLSDERTMGLIRTRAIVPDYTTGAFQMSDILFGSSVEEDTSGAGAAGSPGTVVRNGWRVVPQPIRQFEKSVAPCLYFELYGLMPDRDGRYRYEIEYALSRREKKGFLAFLRGGSKAKLSPGVSATFERETRSPDDAQWIGIDTSDLPPDTYSIEIRVKDLVNSAEMSRKESFVVTGEPG